MVNQDGTTLTEIDPEECGGDGIQESPSNHLVVFPQSIYLVQPEAKWIHIYREWPPCNTEFTGDEKGGLLASIHRETIHANPELRIYELPGGKILDQFPLVKCPDQSNFCNIPDGIWPEIKWSPNGRYLAFSALWSGPSTDLYVYDTETGKTRQLTNGPDHVGPIWWTPDGSQIIMGEILFEDFYGGTGSPSSLWVVSVSYDDIRLLYSLEHPYPQGLIGWLDESRFIVFDGSNLYNALDLPAYNIRLVDMNSGEITTMFKGSFVAAALDRAHETLAFYAYDPEPGPGYDGQGIYLVSTSNFTIHHVEGVTQPTWDDDAGLFVTSEPCEDDPASRTGFNYKGVLKCVHHELSLSSPDGKWDVVLQGGFWLKSEDKKEVLVSGDLPTQIIWRPDSAGVFFIVDQNLYYTSLPEIDVKLVDSVGYSIVFRWVGGD